MNIIYSGGKASGIRDPNVKPKRKYGVNYIEKRINGKTYVYRATGRKATEGGKTWHEFSLN